MLEAGAGAGAVVVTTGEADAKFCTMMGGVVAVFPFGHLTAAMRMITTMITMTAAPLDPSRGIFMESRKSRKEVVGSSIRESKATLLRTNTVLLTFSFSSSECCSTISIR